MPPRPCRCRFLLLEHRAQINRPSSGVTPLYAACSGRHYDLASFLERGADPSLALPSARDGAADVRGTSWRKERLLMIMAKQLTEGALLRYSSWRTPQRRSAWISPGPRGHASDLTCARRRLTAGYDFKAGDLVVAKVAFKNVQGDLARSRRSPQGSFAGRRGLRPGKGYTTMGGARCASRAFGSRLQLGDQAFP